MITKPRLTLLLANVLVLGLALSALAAGRTTVELDPRLADAPLAAPGEWFDSQRASDRADGLLPRDAYAKAIEQAAAARARTEAADPAIAAAEWSLMGPTNIGGRIAGLAADRADLNTVYIAAASGGVWKSTDAGTTFARAWPDDVTQSMGGIAVAADGTVFAGTGESNPGGGSITYGGTGIYRSKDKGATWQRVGLPASGSFGTLLAHPTDPKVVFAAASGNLFLPGGQRGLYKTDDAGQTWKRVLKGDNDTTGAVDVAFDPNNPQVMLAATWDRHRTPSHREYAGPGSKVYRSTDGGETWTETSVSMPDPAQNGRIGVAFAPSDSSRAYAMIANQRNGTAGQLFRSDDNGKTWTGIPMDSTLRSSMSSYGWWFGPVTVDPTNKDRLFVAGLELIESVNGGQTFLPHSVGIVGVVTGLHQASVHSDQQAMAWHPTIPGRVYLGNDGGFYRSDANGLPGTWVASVSQGWTQHYSVDVGEQTPGYVVTGLQDNMCQRNSVRAGVGTPATWTKYGLCGDGLQTLINPVDESITYYCSQYGGCGRAKEGAPELLGAMPKPSGQRWGWFSPLEFDPNNPSVMYWGSNRVFRSTNGGTSWTRISDDLTYDLEQLDPHNGYRIRHVVTAIGISKSNSTVLMAGTDDGRVWRTESLDADGWTEITSEAFPDAWVTDVAIDPSDDKVAYVTFSGFRSGDDAAHVLRTADGGATWTDISGDLPSAPTNKIIPVADALVVGTDVGVYLSKDLGQTWLRVGKNLPTIPVLDLRWHAGTKTLTVATFGHGIQRTTLPL